MSELVHNGNSDPMRPECAKEFGKIESALNFEKEWREIQTKMLTNIEKEIEKLTGNGNRGKIDELGVRLKSIEDLLREFAASGAARQLRIERLEEITRLLESRLFSTSLKIAGVVGAAAIVIQLLVDHFVIP